MRHHTSPRQRPSNPLPTTPSWNSRKRRRIPHSILPCFALQSALYRTKPPPHPHHLLQKPPQFPTHLTGTYPHATHHRQTPKQHQHSLRPHFRIPRHHLHHHLPHPLPALRTLSSSPPMFPFYPKHVRGTHPSIPPGWAPHNPIALHIQQHLHASPYRSPFHVLTGTANYYPSTFPLTSNTTSIPQHIPLDDQPHHVPRRQLTSTQPLPPIPPQYSHQCLLFQTHR